MDVLQHIARVRHQRHVQPDGERGGGVPHQLLRPTPARPRPQSPGPLDAPCEAPVVGKTCRHLGELLGADRQREKGADRPSDDQEVRLCRVRADWRGGLRASRLKIARQVLRSARLLEADVLLAGRGGAVHARGPAQLRHVELRRARERARLHQAREGAASQLH